jgi:predicted alpha/beta-hydrolase family hydrolase
MTRPGALLLAPGAGSNRENPSPRPAGPPPPDRPPVLLAAVVEEAAGLVAEAHVRPNRLALGGRSMGGRICSMAVADGLPAAALVLISYPLHPPGKPENLRVEHLPRITVPCLFVSGTRDPFGTPEELEAATASIAGPVTHEWIDRAGHELKGAEARLASTVAGWLGALR